MTTDITELAQRARINAECGEHLSPAETIALVEALEKAQQRNGELETYSKTTLEFREAARDENRHLKLELEIAEKRIAELDRKNSELNSLTQRWAVERAENAERIACLEESHAQVIQSRDHYKRISEEGLKQLAESRTVTVKLPDDEDGQAYGFGKWANGKLPATAGTMTIAYCEDAWRAAFEVFSSAAGIKWEAE